MRLPLRLPFSSFVSLPHFLFLLLTYISVSCSRWRLLAFVVVGCGCLVVGWQFVGGEEPSLDTVPIQSIGTVSRLSRTIAKNVERNQGSSSTFFAIVLETVLTQWELDRHCFGLGLDLGLVLVLMIVPRMLHETPKPVLLPYGVCLVRCVEIQPI
jgi:hypothetical protein